jgi:predicted ATP-dependent protease
MNDSKTPVAGERSAPPAGSVQIEPFKADVTVELQAAGNRLTFLKMLFATRIKLNFVSVTVNFRPESPNNSLSGPATASGVGYAGGVGSDS